MQRSQVLGSPGRRPKQDARDSHVLEGPSERRNAVWVAEHWLDAGAR